MPIAYSMAAGMGGIRTAGDLVMWMQLTRKMKLAEAKQYVAEKLKVSLMDMVDECVMRDLRKDLGIGTITAELLGININSVNKFKERAGLLIPATEKVE